MAITIYTKVKMLSLEQKKELYYRQKSWGYKKLFDKIGMNWEPAEEILLMAKNKPLFTNWNIPKDKHKAAELLKKILDPRIEIPTEAYIKPI